MIVRREKMRKEIHRTSVDIFYKQNDILLEQIENNYDDDIPDMNHQATKFCRFSDSYCTEKQTEEDTGEKVTIFDETLEETSIILNNSQLEVLDPRDLERPSPIKKKHKQTRNGEIKKEDITTTTNNTERNIFDLLEPERKIDIYLRTGFTDDEMSDSELSNISENKWNGRMARSNRISTPVRELTDRIVKKDCVKSLNSLKEKLRGTNNVKIVSKIHETIEHANEKPSENGFVDLFKPIKNKINVKENSFNEDYTVSNKPPLPNHGMVPKRSNIPHRGKRRFRNLYEEIMHEPRRHSPRFYKSPDYNLPSKSENAILNNDSSNKEAIENNVGEEEINKKDLSADDADIKLSPTEHNKPKHISNNIETDEGFVPNKHLIDNTPSKESSTSNILIDNIPSKNLSKGNNLTGNSPSKKSNISNICNDFEKINIPKKKLDENGISKEMLEENNTDKKKSEVSVTPGRKRRRLNSSIPPCSSEIKLKHENFLRITRSRVSSYS